MKYIIMNFLRNFFKKTKPEKLEFVLDRSWGDLYSNNPPNLYWIVSYWSEDVDGKDVVVSTAMKRKADGFYDDLGTFKTEQEAMDSCQKDYEKQDITEFKTSKGLP